MYLGNFGYRMNYAPFLIPAPPHPMWYRFSEKKRDLKTGSPGYSECWY
jgi:hypothetical protein